MIPFLGFFISSHFSSHAPAHCPHYVKHKWCRSFFKMQGDRQGLRLLKMKLWRISLGRNTKPNYKGLLKHYTKREPVIISATRGVCCFWGCPPPLLTPPFPLSPSPLLLFLLPLPSSLSLIPSLLYLLFAPFPCTAYPLCLPNVICSYIRSPHRCQQHQ